MLQDKLDQQQQLKNSGRRSRKDQQGRDYVCGCALYTHIKTKHDGQRPEGTLRIGPTILNKKNNINNSNNSLNNNLIPITTLVTINKNQSTNQIKSKLNLQILKSIQELVKIDDLRILKQMNEQAMGYTLPDNRIKRLQVGEYLYQNYSTLVKQSQNELSDDNFFNNYVNLSNKTPLDIVLISYLLAVGQFVSENMMEYYTNFGRLFYQCFNDHVEQIYQVCYKNNNQYNNQQQKQRQRQKDNLQKCYQYSFPPSSSKSRSYNNVINKQHMHSYNNISNNLTNIQINTKQCKYSPIICQFFIKYFIISENDLEYYKSIIELICNDFCLWMYRKKMTVVQIGLKKKYQVYRKDMINIRQKSINTIIQYPKNLPTNVQIEQQSIKKDKDTNNQYKDKLKKKQKQKINKISPSTINNYNNNNNNNNNCNNNNNNNNSNSNIRKKNNSTTNTNSKNIKPLANKNYIKNSQYIQNSQNEYNIDYKNSENNDINPNDEQSYKISHEIGHEQIGRDRSGSINQFINGHNFSELQHQNIQENDHGAGNIIQQGNHGINNGGGNIQNHVNQEQIQKYFFAHK